MHTIFISALWLIENGYIINGMTAKCTLTPEQLNAVNSGTYLGALAVLDDTRATSEFLVPFVKAIYNDAEISVPHSQVTRVEKTA